MTRKKAASVVSILLFLFTALLWTAQQFHTRPELSRRLGAWWDGAEYLDLEGVTLQRSFNDCGPTALKMVLDYYGITASGEGLAKEMNLSRKGVTLRHLQKTARTKGLPCEAKEITFTLLRRCKEPTIVLQRNSHFVVVDRIDQAGYVYVRDPSLGHLKYSEKVFTKRWTGLALLFHHPTNRTVDTLDVLCDRRSAKWIWFPSADTPSIL